MTTMIAEVYDSRFGEIKSELAGVKIEMAGVSGEVRNLRWMTGFNLALTVAVLLKLFVH